MKHVITAADFTPTFLDESIKSAQKFRKGDRPPIDGRKKVTLFFPEPSTRTCRSYEEACRKIGTDVSVVVGTEATSLVKGESLSASCRMLAGYGTDVLVMRTSIEGGARWAAEMLQRYGYSTAVHNAGDGANQHPTQAVLDLLTILQHRSGLSGLTIGFVGDNRHSRTVHSFLGALRFLDLLKVVLVSAEETKLQPWYTIGLPSVEETGDLKALRACDFVYVTRVQKERFANPVEYERVRGRFVIDGAVLAQLKAGALIMHPQPIADNEVHPSIWSDPRVIMDEQARCGVPARMALLNTSFIRLRDQLDLTVAEPELEEGQKRPIDVSIQRKRARQHYFFPIDHGTVLDHLPLGMGSRIRFMLASQGVDLTKGVSQPTENLQTGKFDGNKDRLMLEHVFLTPSQLGAVAVLAPKVTVNIFRDGVHEKLVPSKIPEVVGIGCCPNPNCVTRLDPEAALFPRFAVLNEPSSLTLACHYCEQHADRGEVFA